MSPTRVVRKALTAALLFGVSSHQWPMRRNEQRPMTSQPKRMPSVVALCTIQNIAAVKRFSEAK